MAAVPTIVDSNKINRENLVAVTTGSTELLSNGSFATFVLGVENIDLTMLWLRLKHIEKTMSASPSIVFIEIDPYIGAGLAKEQNFDQKISRFAFPRNIEALESMIETAKKSNIDESTNVTNLNISVSVSQLCFEAKKKKTRNIYDQYYAATKEVMELDKEIADFKAKMNGGNPDDEEDLQASAKEAARLGGLMKECVDRKKTAKKNWDNERDKVLSKLDDDDLYVTIHGDLVSLKKLFSKNSTITDIHTFRAAIFDPHQHAIALVYHGDANMRVHTTDIDTFAYEWMKARVATIETYEKTLEKILTSFVPIPSDQWPMPNRVTDAFLFTLSFSSITLFIEGLIASRHKLLVALSAVRLRSQEEKEEEARLLKFREKAESEFGDFPTPSFSTDLVSDEAQMIDVDSVD